jgi:hypothetical protein
MNDSLDTAEERNAIADALNGLPMLAREISGDGKRRA